MLREKLSGERSNNTGFAKKFHRNYWTARSLTVRNFNAHLRSAAVNSISRKSPSAMLYSFW
jgi:hypothetical protein